MKYYNGTALLNKDCIYNFIAGGRASGKSYWMARFLLTEYLNKGKKFVRVIRNLSFAQGLENYFRVVEQDLADQGLLPDGYPGITMKGFEYRIGDIGIGRILSLSQEQKYKSLVFDNDYSYLVFEEFIANDISEYWQSPKYEIQCLQSIISTVFRHRTGKVFFIGNNYEVNNPYFEHYGIDVNKVKLGKISTFQSYIELNGKKVKGASVAIEYVPMAYENVDEIPMMLRTAENDMATSGNITKSRHILEGCIKLIKTGLGVEGILIDGIKLDHPKIFRTFWRRSAQYGSDDPADDNNYREYIIVLDRSGMCLIRQMSDNDIIDLSMFSQQQLDMVANTNGVYPMQQAYMHFPLDIEMETGSKVNVLYFSDQTSEYNFRQDCMDLKTLRSLTNDLGFGCTPQTETAKDYVAACTSAGLHGYGVDRKGMYSYATDLIYENYAANGLLTTKKFDVNHYIKTKCINHEPDNSFDLLATKQSLAQQALKAELKAKYGDKLLKSKAKQLDVQLDNNPDDVLERVQAAIADKALADIFDYCPANLDNKGLMDLIDSIKRKVHNVVTNSVTINNIKDYYGILVNPDYDCYPDQLDSYIDSAVDKVDKYLQRHVSRPAKVSSAMQLPDGYSNNTSDYMTCPDPTDTTIATRWSAERYLMDSCE